MMDARDVLEVVATAYAAEEDLLDGEDAGLVHLARLPAREARSSPLPADLPPTLLARLTHRGITSLFTHQHEALARIRDGEHVVVATGTASGKTLAYHLPLLERILADDRSTALYLAPTKALARDQLRTLRGWKLPQVRAAALDGDVDRAEREAIRRTANVVLTNPDLLHHSMLADHKRWADFLHRLDFIVVDESHVARGVFGSHVALVLRRLRRLCERYSAAPQFILASATIGNPGEHASRLTGLPVTAIRDDGSARSAMDVGLWQPSFIDRESGRRRSMLRESARMMSSFVAADVQTLTFVKSRKAAELIAKFTRERLTSEQAKRVSSYRGGYLADERRDLERKLTSGELLGVAATSALELGIDVGGLDAVVLAGYPGTIASFWQRLGRAGRGEASATGVLIAADDPLDQYLVAHPEVLLTKDPEDAIIDPENPYILGPHLRCAAAELPMSRDDATQWFGDTSEELLAEAEADGDLRQRGGLFHWTGRQRASSSVDIRSTGGGSFTIVDGETGQVIGDVDGGRAYEQVHPGAIYLHLGQQYEIAQLDLARRVAVAMAAPSINHATRARSDTDVTILEVTKSMSWGDIDIYLGRVQVDVTVTGYEVFRPGSDGVLDRIELDLPSNELATVAVWYTIPEATLRAAKLAQRDWPGSLHAAEHAAIGLLPLIALCDRWDIGGLSTARHQDTGMPTVFIYDGYPGGAGLAERSYLRLGEHLRATRETIGRCACSTGCPGCVQSPKCGNGNDPLDKAGALVVLDLLLAREPVS